MQPQDDEALEEAAWRDFVVNLGAQLARTWPATQERLGERYDAFIEHAVAQALQRGVTHAAGVARYVNLCIVWGPSFQDRPGFEWARGLLAAPPVQEWLTAHQLVRRSLAELARRPETRIEPATLVAADNLLLDLFGTSGRHGAMRPTEPAALPRAACDLEAAELRLVEGTTISAYQPDGDDWKWAPVPAPAALRMNLAHPAPAVVSVLTCAKGQGVATRLQARLRAHTVCDGDHHPAVGFGGSHGLWQWRGHETRAVSWPVTTLTQPEQAGGSGTAIAEETSPEIHRLDFEVCGLRDDGDALGGTRMQVWAFPSTQWWVDIQRQAAPAQTIKLAPNEVARATTRCRVEADNSAKDSSRLEAAFAQGLDAKCAKSLQRIAEQWAGLAGLEKPEVQGSLAVLVGRAALTWGWTHGAQGLAGRALMRVCGRLALSACRVDLQLAGELDHGGARARIRIVLKGDVPLAQEIRRESDELPLFESVLPLKVKVELPVKVELAPLAGDGGGLLQAAGPAAGALEGEVGLRPRLSGGSGWEWFADLRLTPITVPVALTDPLQGQVVRMLPLLPPQSVLAWSMG